MSQESSPIKVVDSHTAGEPTRVVIEGGPDLGSGTLAERFERFKTQHDSFRRTVILEPRGYDAMVGALLCPADDPNCETAILFFNNEGYLNMCGHATIGAAITLSHLGRLNVGKCKFQTPAGVIEVNLHDSNRASFRNVPSFVLQKNVRIELDQLGTVVGDIAYGGNWFFVTRPPADLQRKNIELLLGMARMIRGEVEKLFLDELNGGRIDHIQFFDPDVQGRCSQNFVVCPGGEFDRSPCGTGTSAAMAILAANGDLAEEETWTQESLTGGRFVGTFRFEKGGSGRIMPMIEGQAFICAESSLLQHSADPYRFGNVIKIAASKTDV